MRLSTLTLVSSAMTAAAISTSPAIATASPATDAAAVTHGVEASIADVPWSEVGPGWTLATWSPVTPQMPGARTGSRRADLGDGVDHAVPRRPHR